MTVGLTGGIGSGKSTVATLLGLLGCALFQSDQVAKEVYFNPDTRRAVINLLGKESYVSVLQLNKPYISSKIFNDPALLKALNALIHPAVTLQFEGFAKKNAGKIIVKESALLYEAGLASQLDKIIVVASGDALRINRVMARDRLSEEAVYKKIQSQLPQEEKIRLADFVIHNDEKDFLIPQVLAIFNTLRGLTSL